jgi:hypothetical protein
MLLLLQVKLSIWGGELVRHKGRYTSPVPAADTDDEEVSPPRSKLSGRPRMSVELDSLLTHSPEVRHGRVRIAGAGITARRAAVLTNLGHSPEE